MPRKPAVPTISKQTDRPKSAPAKEPPEPRHLEQFDLWAALEGFSEPAEAKQTATSHPAKAPRRRGTRTS
jgi:hypothetical protein